MKILDKIGMSPAYTGYEYWETAIRMAEKENMNMDNLYYRIAEQHNVTHGAVERAMRTSMKSIVNLQKKIDVDYKITTKKFLAWLVHKGA